MSFTAILGIVCWPMVLLAVGLLVVQDARSKRRAQSNDAAMWAAIFIAGVPLFLIVFIYHDETELLIFDANVFYLLFGIVWLCAVARRADFASMPVWTVVNYAVGISAVYIGGWYALGDFVLSRPHVEGAVGKKYVTRGKAGVHYHVSVNGQLYYITGDLFGTIREGDNVEVSFGGASSTIFRARTISTK
jgi:hypothetical protein